MDLLTGRSEYTDLHLGIDYGTSASKMVLRNFGAAGGERSILLGKEYSYRYPSTIVVGDGKVYFGKDAQPGSLDNGFSAYHSLKMRIADDVKGTKGEYFFGVPIEYPNGVSAVDLAIVYLWHLISKAHKEVVNQLRIENPRMGVTIGVPMSFYEDEDLKSAFLMIIRAAFQLYRSKGLLVDKSLEISKVIKFSKESRKTIEGRGPIAGDQVRNWMRSEAEAAMLWAFRSPRVAAGRYFEIDVGAGTTNASVFNISSTYIDGRWVKSGMVFFGAASAPIGMDKICRSIANGLGIDDLTAIRQCENERLQDRALYARVRPDIDELRSVLDRAWGNAYHAINQPNELRHWDAIPVFTVGGGNKITKIRNRIAHHPSNQIDGRNRRLRAINATCPPDLSAQGNVAIEQFLAFSMVAYGLSNLDLAVPNAVMPMEVEPMQGLPRRRNLHFDEIYGDG